MIDSKKKTKKEKSEQLLSLLLSNYLERTRCLFRKELTYGAIVKYKHFSHGWHTPCRRSILILTLIMSHCDDIVTCWPNYMFPHTWAIITISHNVTNTYYVIIAIPFIICLQHIVVIIIVISSLLLQWIKNTQTFIPKVGNFLLLTIRYKNKWMHLAS